MKKLLRLLLLLLLLGLGFLYIVKNPELGISQTVLKAIGLERLLISDEPIAMGTGTFTLDEIGTTFTLPIDRTLSGAVMTGNEETTFILSTPEVDNKHYPMYIHGSLQKSTDTLEEVQQTFQVQLTGNGQTFSIDCDGVAPSKCLGVFINSGIYIVGLNSQSDQPDEDPNAPTSVYFPRFAQIQDAINAILYSAIVVPPVMTGSELSGADIINNMTAGKNTLQKLGKKTNAGMYTINFIEGTTKDKLEIILNGTDKKYVELPYDKTCEGGDTGPCAKFGEFVYNTNDRYILFRYTAYNEAGVSALDLDDLSIDSLFQITDDTIFDTTKNGYQFFIGNSQSFDPTFRITYKNDISKNKEIGTFKVYGYYDDGSYLYLHTDDGEYQSTKKFLRKIDLNTLETQITELQ